MRKGFKNVFLGFKSAAIGCAAVGKDSAFFLRQ